ncbi:MAG: holo-ACP synthase [Candidatus Auribacterota bacterium]|nr:holo-ACP synthase [Candidatus Auribacterota bacterium]
MNISIGIDIEEIKRFEGKEGNDRDRFLGKIFTDRELEWCLARECPARHLAVRFSAKEAIIKAFSDLDQAIFFNQIEIRKNKKNVPYAVTHLDDRYRIKISMSHAEEYVAAVALILNIA